MFKDYISLAQKRLKWYKYYYINYKEEFIPAFRNYYEKLSTVKDKINPFIFHSYLQYLVKVFLYLWAHEMYAIKLSNFIQDFAIHVDLISRHYYLLFYN